MNFSEKKLIKWFGYILGCIAFVFASFYRLNMAVLSPDIIQTFALSNTLLGLMSGMYFYAYSSLQPIVGVLVDKWKPKKVLVSFVFLMSLSAFIFAYSPNLPLLFLGRFLMGVGSAGIFIPVSWMITKYFDYSKRGSLFSIFIFTGNIGAVLAASPFEKLISIYKWRNALGIIAFITFVLTLLIYLFAKNDNSISEEKNSFNNKKMKDSWFIVLRNTLKIPIIRYCLCTFLSYGAMVALQGLWVIPFLTGVYGFEKNIASNFVTLIPIGFMIGTLIFAKINDTKYNKYVFFMSMFLSALVYLTFAVFTNKLSNNIIMLMFFLIGFCHGTVPFILKLYSLFLPKKTYATSLGILNVFPVLLCALFQNFTGFLFDILKSNSLMSYKAYFFFSFFTLAMATWASVHIIKIINRSYSNFINLAGTPHL